MFRKEGQLPRNLKFYYNGSELSIINSFSYLGVVFTPGGSFSSAQSTLYGKAQKAIRKPRTLSIVQFIFFFWSFENRGNILRNQKLLYV